MMFEMAKSHVPLDNLAETMTVLWDLRKHCCELAMTFKQIAPDFDDSIERWLEQTSYTQKEKEKLKQEIEESGVIKVKDRACKCFVKAESYPEFKYPRPIKSRTDRFKAKMGPIFQEINNLLFSNTDWYIKKIPVDERAKHLSEILHKLQDFICTDFTSFEAHFINLLIYTIEMPLYVWMTMRLQNATWWQDELRTLMSMNTCKFKDFIVWCMSRASGEMNTSSGNGWSNLCLNTYTTRVKGATSFKGQFEGDDANTTTIPSTAAQTTADFTKLGWSCKLEKHKKFEEASFCGLVADLEDMITVCDIRQYLAEFGWTKQQYLGANDITIKALIRAKSFSAVYQYKGCPVIDALGHYGLRITDAIEVKRKFDKLLSKGKMWDNRYKQQMFEQMHIKYKNTLPTRVKSPINTRRLVEKLYNVTIAEQLEIENYLDSKQDISSLEIEINTFEVWKYTWDTFVGDEEEQETSLHAELEEFRKFAANFPGILVDF
jgi:hypothetical protein